MSTIMPISSCLKAARITKLHQTCNLICRNDPLCTAFMKRYELCQPKTRNMDWICLLIRYMCSYKIGHSGRKFCTLYAPLYSYRTDNNFMRRIMVVSVSGVCHSQYRSMHQQHNNLHRWQQNTAICTSFLTWTSFRKFIKFIVSHCYLWMCTLLTIFHK